MKRPVALLVCCMFLALTASWGQEGSSDYESFNNRLLEFESALAGGDITEADVERLSDLIAELSKTSYGALRNKAEVMRFMAKDRLALKAEESNRAALEAKLAEELEARRKAERTGRNKRVLTATALVAGGIALVVSDLAFSFADNAYENYFTDNAAVGGYYQQMWQILDLTGIISGGFGLAALLGASRSLAGEEEPDITAVYAPLFTPPGNLLLTGPEERIAAVEEDIRLTTEKLQKTEKRLAWNRGAGAVSLTAGVLSFITSGVSAYLADEMARQLDADPDNMSIAGRQDLYDEIANISAASGLSCLTGSLLLKAFRPRPALVERRLAELTAYRKTLEEASAF